MFETSQLVIVRNPFDRTDREVRDLTCTGRMTVAALVGEYLPADLPVTVSVNGLVIDPMLWGQEIVAGDQVVVVPRVGEGGKGLLGAVLMIALVYSSGGLGALAADAIWGAGAASSLVGVGTLTWGGLIGAGIGLVGSMVIGALVAPTKPSMTGSTSSQVYSWAPMTTQLPGAPIVRAYGRVKLYGNIIAGYIEDTGDTNGDQMAHMLIELGLGPYESLSDFKINDQDISLYTGVKVTQRIGLLNQTAIPSFNDTRSASVFTPAKVVSGTPITRATTGTQFSTLEVVLTCPSGLWYANDTGGFDKHTVYVKIEVSKNSGAFGPIVGSASASSTSAAGYWSAGVWLPGEFGIDVWFEESAGSSVRTDHLDGDSAGVIGGFENAAMWRWIGTAQDVNATPSASITLSGQSQTAIRKTFRIEGFAPGDTCAIKVTNLSTDYTGNSRYGDAVYLSSINEVILDDFIYPRSVLVGVDALATSQLSGSMKFSCIADAALVRVYNGSTWSFEWSQDPAWITFDVLTQPVMNDAGTTVLRYDGFDPSRLDLQSFVDWSTFCNVLVPDGLGLGGTEVRCQFDGVFDIETDMWSAALDVASTARATLVTRGTQISVVYDDARTTPTQVFTVANESQFTETFLPMEGRASVIEVVFANRDADYGMDKVSYINDAVVAASGVSTPVTKTLKITRGSQAWREVNTMLVRNQYLKRTAGISVDIDSLASTVGDRVDIQADVPQWGDGGRVVSGTTTSVVLDHPITFASSAAHDITVRLSYTVRVFTVTAASATAGATYTNNNCTFTVRTTIAGATTLYVLGQGNPEASGVLTKATGTGDATIAFSSSVQDASSSDAIETKAITMPGGGYPQTVSSVTCAAFSHAPNQYDVWAIGTVGQSTKPFLITDIARDTDQRAQLTLIEYNASCYGLDSGIPAIPTPNVSASVGFGSITNVVFATPQVSAEGGAAHAVVEVQWAFSDRSKVLATIIEVRPTSTTNNAAVDLVRVLGNTAQFTNLQEDATYQFRFLSENYLGQIQPMSSAAVELYTVPPLSGAPNAPTSVKLFCTPDAQGAITRAKVRANFTQGIGPFYADQYLAFMVSVESEPPTFTVAADSSTKLEMSAIDIISSGSDYTVKAGSTTSRLVVTDATQPLTLTTNLAGMYWAQFGASQWRKVTSYDTLGFDFATPFDISPSPGDTINWAETSWADERDTQYRMAVLSAGGQTEVVLWDRITQIAGVFYLDGLTRAQEGTVQIDATGGTAAYYPAPGAGTQLFSLPCATMIPQGSNVFEGEINLNLTVPAGAWVAATAAIYRNTTTGIVRSNIVPASYGGPL